MVGIIILQIVLIILNAIFSSAEISVISMNETKIKQMAEEGDRRAEKAVLLLEKPAKFLEAIQAAVTFAGLLSGAFVAVYFAEFVKRTLFNCESIFRWSVSFNKILVGVTLVELDHLNTVRIFCADNGISKSFGSKSFSNSRCAL